MSHQNQQFMDVVKDVLDQIDRSSNGEIKEIRLVQQWRKVDDSERKERVVHAYAKVLNYYHAERSM